MFGSPDDRGPTVLTPVPVRCLCRPLHSRATPCSRSCGRLDPGTAEAPTSQLQKPVDDSTGCHPPTVAARRSGLFEHIHSLTVVDTLIRRSASEDHPGRPTGEPAPADIDERA